MVGQLQITNYKLRIQMATPKSNSNTKVTQTSFGISLASANRDGFPLTYGDDVWDNVYEGSELADILAGSGQFDQHTVNEALAEKINAAATAGVLAEAVQSLADDLEDGLDLKIDKASHKTFGTFRWNPTASRTEASDTDAAFLALDVADGDLVTVAYGYVNNSSGVEYFGWFAYHITPTETEEVQIGRHNPLILRAHRDTDDNLYFTRESYPKTMMDSTPHGVWPAGGAWIHELHDGNVYEYEPTADFTMPRIPAAEHNRLGIAIYITPQSDCEMQFFAAYGPVLWLGEAPADFTLRYGTKWLMTIVDGICSLQPIMGYEPDDPASPLTFTSGGEEEEEEPTGDESPVTLNANNSGTINEDGEEVE